MSFNTHQADRKMQPRSSGHLSDCAGISLCFVIFAIKENRLKVLCKRTAEDNGLQEDWTLPIGIADLDEGIRKSAKKSLQDFTHSENVFHEQLQTFGGGGFGSLTVAYYALLPVEDCAQMTSTQEEMLWSDPEKLPSLSLQHGELVSLAVRSLRLRASYEPVIFRLLPERFTLLQLQQVYETVMNVRSSKSNFRRKVAKMEFVVPSQLWQQKVAHRAARLFEFDERKYLETCKKGFFMSF